VSVLTLAQAKAFQDITVATYDTELQSFIDSAESAITKKVGPLTSTSVTKVVDGRSSSLSLPVTPVVSLTSITGNAGEIVLPADVTVLPPGIIRYTNGGYCFGSLWYTVVYTAGRASCPPDLLDAVKWMVKSQWTSQRGSGRGSTPDDPGPGQGYQFPYRVLELMAPYLQTGFA
jgi:hypothetical protein